MDEGVGKKRNRRGPNGKKGENRKAPGTLGGKVLCRTAKEKKKKTASKRESNERKTVIKRLKRKKKTTGKKS